MVIYGTSKNPSVSKIPANHSLNFQSWCVLNSHCRVAAHMEWTTLYIVGKDKDGLLSKETVRSVYDGSLFYKLEKERNH